MQLSAVRILKYRKQVSTKQISLQTEKSFLEHKEQSPNSKFLIIPKKLKKNHTLFQQNIKVVDVT